MPRARVLRVLEYEGDLSDILAHFEKRGVIQVYSFRGNSGQDVEIREAILGQWPQLMAREEAKEDPNAKR